MYARFRQQFVVDEGEVAEEPRRPWPLGEVAGFEELMVGVGPRSFNRGLYRLHSETSGRKADAWVAMLRSDLRGQVFCFGYDWMGCQFALDAGRIVGGEPQILCFDPATGDVYLVDQSFHEFHEVELIEGTNNGLAISAFDEWAEANPSAVPLDRTECVGQRHPLFLGGEDTLENSEVVDIEVYWVLQAQVLRQVNNLPDGTRISAVKVSE